MKFNALADRYLDYHQKDSKSKNNLTQKKKGMKKNSLLFLALLFAVAISA